MELEVEGYSLRAHAGQGLMRDEPPTSFWLLEAGTLLCQCRQHEQGQRGYYFGTGSEVKSKLGC